MTAFSLHQPRRHIHPRAENHGEQDEDNAFIAQPEGVKVATHATATGSGGREGVDARGSVGRWKERAGMAECG